MLSQPLPESKFSFTIARVAVAQICQSMGFKGAQSPALEALTDVATRYLQAIAKLAVASANSDGRTESNLADIIVALEDLASVQGFRGLSSVRSLSLYASAVIKDLMKFVEYTDEIPFARPLPPRGICLRTANGKYRGDGDSDGRWRHMPRWLPAAPVAGGAKRVVETETEKEVIWGCLSGGEDGEDEK